MKRMYRVGLLSALCLAVAVTSCVLAADQLTPVQKAIDALAQKLTMPAADIQVVSVEGMDWPDTSLGAPQPGMMYAQVITPGYKVVLRTGGHRYQYHTDMGERAVLARLDGARVTQAEAAPQIQAVPSSAEGCRTDLARRLNIPADEITVARSAAVSFPDTSLGLPEPGKVYAQVVTPGVVLVLKARNAEYLYATAGPVYRYGGPLDAARYSAVYLEPIPNEPNLNGNLVQVSLVGTNPKIMLPAVSGYRPQPNGSILAIRRTSRSGFDLLYMAPGRCGQGTKLASASDLGDAAVNEAGTRWVAFSRPGFGVPWQASWGALDGGSEPQGQINVPGDLRPGRMYWHMTHPVAALRNGEGTVYYELILIGATPQWRKLDGFFPPPTEEYMLNKSETLVVKTAQENGQPVTRIIKQWFTGDEKPVAMIVNCTPNEMSLAGRRFLVLSGRRGDKTLGVTVDIATGEVLETVTETDSPVRLLLAPPQGLIYLQIPPAQ